MDDAGYDNPSSTIDMQSAHDFDASTEKLATASLDEMQSQDYRHILDVVDRLRTCGLGSILQLPQLVVCGNQSAGKSSVLEAITEVPFPRKENLCTRFATEIVLRRNKVESLHIKIIPDKARPDDEKAMLHTFSEAITDFSQLPVLIDKATEAMGLDTPMHDDQTANRAFTRDVLSVEIAGPSRPQLTLVDLPGLILSANKMQTEADVKLIHSLVNDYIVEKRTIMLAVISAKDDYANQGILTKCKEVDKDGHRTLGIVTKPDFLRKGSSNEKTWINLAQNKDIFFELGWHMLKNRSEDEADDSFAARNASERAFFSTGQYKSLAARDKGITALRTKLSKLLFQHLKKELPTLQTELNAKYLETINELRSLGEKRSTQAEQRRFLVSIAGSYHAVITAAVEGHYEHPFFSSADPDEEYGSPGYVRQLRAAVQHVNLQFASQMRQFGHRYKILSAEGSVGTESERSLPEPELEEEYAQAHSLQTISSREDAVDWVKGILKKTRGRELPGTFNPLVISQVFWEQSSHWETLAQFHVDRVNNLCQTLVQLGVEYVCTPALANVWAKLFDGKLTEALERRRDNAMKELDWIIKDKDRHPITYDPTYTERVQESRSQKTSARLQALIDQSKYNVNVQTKHGSSAQLEERSIVNADVLKTKFKDLFEPDMDKISAEDALDCQLAFYSDKVKFFIAAVTEQVIERHLLTDLADDTLSPLAINDMSDQEVEYLAAEGDGVKRQREFLEDHKAILEQGQEAFRKAMGSYKSK